MRDPNCIRRRLLRISRQCYDPATADEICRWTAVVAGGSANPFACEKGEDSALVGTIELHGGTDAIVVACRGTLFHFGSDEQRAATALDWLNNDKCGQIAFDRNRPGLGKIHFGFHEAVKSIWDPLNERVEALIAEKPARPVYVSGHSKGGAMAFIVAMKLHLLHPASAIRVVTFAAARPGDAQFANAYDAMGIPTTRYESWPDPVPELPPGTRGSWLLRQFIAPLFRLPQIKDLRIADLPPFYPVGTRAPSGSWMMDTLRNLFAGAVVDPRKLVLAHAIDPGTRYDVLVCSENGADECNHR